MYVLAISNPIFVRKAECNTAVVKFRNNKDAFGINYSLFPLFYQQIRLGINVRKFKLPTKEKIYRDSKGNFLRANVVIDKTRELHTDLMDEATLEDLHTALKHTEVIIDDISYSAQGELEIEDNDYTNLANATATLYVQGYNRTNISCQ